MWFLLPCGCTKPTTQATQAESESRPLQLKVVSFVNPRLPVIGETLVRLTERLDTASGGNIKMRMYEPGKLVAALEVLDAVSSGKVEAGFSSAGFWMGKMPAAPIFSSVPFGPRASEFLSWLVAGNGMALYQELYDKYGYDVKVLLCGMIPPETSGWFAKEINSVDDLKGLKMRFFGFGGMVMMKLGVSVNILPGGEIFPALEKRVIDATEYSLPVIDESLGFYKIVDYNYFPGWHQQATTFELLVNKKVWNGLSTTQQTLIELATRDSVIHSLAQGEARQADVMRRNVNVHGVKERVWSSELIDAFREKWEEVVAEQTARDPFFKKVWADYSAFREKYATWESKAYLNR